MIVFCVMAMMAAPIPIEMVRQSITRPWPAVLASIINLAVLPLMGWLGSKWLHSDMGGGLIVASAVPSTLTSAAVLARRAGGDDTVSIFATLITNVACVIVTPLWLILLLGVAVELSMTDMIANLSLVVLLPIFLVQMARLRSLAFARWADRSRVQFSICCQLGILSMVLIGSVQMGARWTGQLSGLAESQGYRWEGSQVLLAVLIGIAIHLAALLLCWVIAARTGVPVAQQKSACFSASQKTLMIGLNLAIHCGVNILPMVTYHVSQLFIDALLAEKWAPKASRKSTGKDRNSGSSSA